MGIFKRMIEAKQQRANRELARFLHDLEFQGETYEHVLNMVENGTLHERYATQ